MDATERLQDAVRDAQDRKAPLRITGRDSKEFLGYPVTGETLDVSAHRGIVHYEPTELVITARAGTSLDELRAVLEQHNQFLPFDPPDFGNGSTLGGTIACGLSGARRPYTGSARDFILGTRLINGKGEVLRFGGEVMKNVAGYDVSRLMAGAQGTLGVLLDISLKVLPKPAAELSLRQEHITSRALDLMNEWASQPIPLSAACHDGKSLYIRLSGAETAVNAARKRLGGELVDEAGRFWASIGDLTHPLLAGAATLWRLSVPAETGPIKLPGQQLIDWGGAQRWYSGDLSADELRETIAARGGHVTCYRQPTTSAPIFQPLPQPLMNLHQRLKHAFDPAGILNPGRLYPEL